MSRPEQTQLFPAAPRPWAERPVRETAPYVRSSDTSRDAARRIAGVLTELQGQVLALLREAGANGLTNDELEQRSGLSHQSCSPRVLELRQKGLVVDSGKRRLTRSGRSATVWIAVETKHEVR